MPRAYAAMYPGMPPLGPCKRYQEGYSRTRADSRISFIRGYNRRIPPPPTPRAPKPTATSKGGNGGKCNNDKLKDVAVRVTGHIDVCSVYLGGRKKKQVYSSYFPP